MKAFLKLITGNYVFVAVIILLFIALLFHSPLRTGSQADMHIDSQVYIHAGGQILEGKILYRDVFDHKGPFFYLLECCGLFFSGEKPIGLWIFQLLFLIVTISPLFIYLKKKSGSILSLAAFAIFIAWLSRTLTIGDNIPELYAVGMISLNYFLYFRITTESKTGSGLMAFFAASAMTLFLVKANLVIAVLPPALWVLYKMQREKKLYNAVVGFLLGGFFILLPFVFYFLYHHALQQAVFAFWDFNFQYIRDQKYTMTQSIFQVFFHSGNFVMVFLLLSVLGKFLFDRKDRAAFLMPLIRVCS